MADDVEVTMFLYTGLLPVEEAVLKSMEPAVVEALHSKSITTRLFWISDAESGARVVRLLLPGQPKLRILLELQPSEVPDITENELVSQLSRSITNG
jgi:hypothetical protein